MQKNTSIPQSGALIVPMTNDYLFRALLQRNNRKRQIFPRLAKNHL